MMSEISAARMSMAILVLAAFWALLGELVAERAELRAEGSVVDRVAQLGDHPPEQVRVFAPGDGDLLARELLERGDDLRQLGGIERPGRRDLGRHPARLGFDHRVDLAR